MQYSKLNSDKRIDLKSANRMHMFGIWGLSVTETVFVYRTCKSAVSVLKESRDKLREGDEEMAYVFLLQYFNLVTLIQNRPDYSREKQFVQELLGSNSRIMEQMNQLEQLQKSLKKRYAFDQTPLSLDYMFG